MDDLIEKEAEYYINSKNIYNKNLLYIIKELTDGIIVFTKDEEVFHISKSSKNTLNLNSDQITTIQDLFEYIHPEDIENFKENYNYVINNYGNSKKINIRFLENECRWKWIETRFVNISENQSLKSMILCFKDNNEQQELKKDLKASLNFSYHLLTNLDDGLIIYDADFNHLEINQAFCKMSGFSEHELIKSRPPYAYWPEQEYKKIGSFIKDLSRGVTNECKVDLLRKDGNKIPVKLYPSLIKDESGVIVSYCIIIKDNSIQKNVKNRLITTDKKLKLAKRAANIGFWQWNLKTDKVFFDDVSLEMLGYFREDFRENLEKGSWWMEQIHPDEKDKIKEKFENFIHGENKNYSVEFRLKNKDDGYTWISSTASIISHDESGEPKDIIGIHQNISGQKEFHKKIEKYATFLDKIIEQSPFSMWVSDKQGTVIRTNEKLRKTLNLSDDQIIGKYNIFKDKNLIEQGLIPEIKKVFSEQKTTRFSIPWKADKGGEQLNFKDGNDLWIDVSLFPITNVDGTVEHVVCQWVDITKQRKIEQDLKKTNERFQILFDKAPDGIYLLDKKGKLVDGNKAAEQISGYKKHELLGKNLLESKLLSKKQLVKSLKILALNNLGKPSGPDEIILTHKNGTKVPIEIHTYPVKLDDERFILGIARDCSYRKKAEKQIKESELNLREAQKIGKLGSWRWNVVEEKLWWSDELYRIFGINKKSYNLTFENISGMIHPDDQKKNQEMVNTLLRTGKTDPITFRILTANGELKWLYQKIESELDDNGNVVLTKGIIQDITEKKEFEEQLIESANKFRTIFNNVTVGIIAVDPETKEFLFANPEIEHITGYTQKELVGLSLNKIRPEKDIPAVYKEFENLLKGKSKIARDIPILRKDNTIVYCDISSTNQVISGKKIIFGVFNDVTDRKYTYDLLKNSEQRYHSIVDNIGVGISLISPDMRILKLNNEMEKWFPDIKVQDKPICYKAFNSPPKEDICEWCPTCKTLQDGKVHESTTDTPSDGKIRHYKIVSSPIFDSNGNVEAAIEMVDDITDELEAKKQLKKAHDELKELNKNLEKNVEERTEEINRLLIQKDEMINQLGHDLKNPLGPIINLVPILMKKETDPKKLELFNAILRSSEYMKNLVIKSIQLAKLNASIIEFDFEEIKLREFCQEVFDSNLLLFKENNIGFENNINDDFVVHADKLQLHEVFNNLFNNAVKYTEGDGLITINAYDRGTMIEISIKDEGIGMTEEQITKIFNEFYKADVSRHDFDSSGLGMSICKRIIEKHDGKIWAESEGIGKGSTIKFTLKKEQTIN